MRALIQKAIYNCEQVREFMYEYLDDALPSLVSFRFKVHIKVCQECREYLFLYKKTANAKDFRKENPAPQQFLDSTLDFLRKEGIITVAGDSEKP